METMMLWLGRAAGVGGAALCAIAVAIRVSGTYWAGGLQVGTLLQGGIAGMVLGCLCFLGVLVQRSGPR